MDIGNTSDARKGFDPQREDTQDELEKIFPKHLHPCSIAGLKKTERESKYLLLELKLEKDGKKFSQLYLRGFEYMSDSHASIGGFFLRGEVDEVLKDYLDVPRWPDAPNFMSKPPKSVVAEKDGLTLTVTAVGGGKFDLKNNQINLRGYSQDFGPVPNEYQSKLIELLETLVQKPAYQGFGINPQ